jgi:molybdopterin-binding protein
MPADSYQTGPVQFAYGKDAPCLEIAGFEVPRGQVTVVTGENGSGKTTLFKLLTGLLAVPGASRNSRALESIISDAVYLHQTPYLFRGTVTRNLLLAAGSRRGAKAQQAVRATVSQALAAVGLSEFGGRRTSALSGGEKKRAALARVLLSNKPLLLLDEPAAHADKPSVRLIEAACRAFADEGRTVVIATHRGSFAYRVADKLYDLQDGKLEQNTSNILNGEVVRRDDGFLHFQSGETEFRAPMRDGEYRVAVVAAEDILLSRRPLDSSARNCLTGRVDGLEPTDHGVIRARIDCGMMLTSLVTASAVADLGLVHGAKVFATFKASSVQLY